MENQAFGRAHRIGQEKETYFVKIVVKDSIDEALLQMQQGKETMIAKALQEDASQKTAPTLEELMRLFGVDADGGAAAGGGDEESTGEVIVLSDDNHDAGEGQGRGESRGEEGEREGEDAGGAAGEEA
jgi:hypothetical protein